LFRDGKRKIIGGVCSGIAYYFKIDPLWIRLLTLVLFLGSYGVLLIVYAVLWAVLPESSDIQESPKIKKMFRNPEDKVLSGVSGGIAVYFGIEATIIRLLFVIFTFIGGTGIIAYIILWIILPEANSITDKVQMQGEPITLSNIESNVKKSLNVQEGEEENVLVKILLFPFRLIAVVFGALGKALGPLLLFLVEFIRIISGVILIMIGFSGLIALIVSLGVFFGVVSGGMLVDWQHVTLLNFGTPLNMFMDNISTFTLVTAAVVSVIPMLVIILLGASIIARRIVFSSAIGWSLFGLFIIGSVILSINIPSIAFAFQKEAEFRESRTYDIPEKTLVLKVNEIGMDEYNAAHIKLRGYGESVVKLDMEFQSRGTSRKDALEHARMVEYFIEENDSILTFDSNITFKDSADFRFQQLHMTLYIPYGKPFIMDDAMRHLLDYSLYKYGYRNYQIEDNTWVFEKEGLKCMTCNPVDDKWDSERRHSNDKVYSRLYDDTDFSSISINSPVSFEIQQGRDYKIEITGDRDYVSDIIVEKNENHINFSFDDADWSDKMFRSRQSIKVFIQMPRIEKLILHQASNGTISGFQGEYFDLEQHGASRLKADLDMDEVNLILHGSSRLELDGSTKKLTANLNGASIMDAGNFKARDVSVTANGASEATVNPSESIHTESDFASTIKNKGTVQENE
ncbi:MAG: PspC domain-containing protein, partial [Cyclobacteriaceae bacterium]|nr:PspC domain-containing protein [Cyclobacteriaceae bacterium]